MATIPPTITSSLIDLAELKDQSGPASFAKGLQLADQDRVHQLERKGDTISATVEGSRTYRVKLQLGQRLTCHCTCPAADYQTVCKHAVATAIAFAINAQEGQGTEGEDTEGEEESEEESESDLLRRHFDQQDKTALLALLLEEVGRDDKRWCYWLNKARLSEQKVTPAALKKQINQALPRESLWNWRDVADYFEQAATLFESIWEGMERLPLLDQWALLNHAIQRLNRVLEQIDDSNGERFDIEEELIARIPALFRQLPWRDEQRAAWLFEHLIETPLDLFPAAAKFGDDCLQPAFLTLCAQGLERLLTTPGDDQDRKWHARRYSEPLISAAKKRGDWRAEATIRARLAETVHDWLALCELCLEHQEPLDAEFWLAKARQRVRNPGDETRCDRMAIRLCEQLGEKPRAWALANQIFEQAPNFDEFRQLRDLQQRLAWQDEGLLARVEQRLIAAYRPTEGSIVRQQSDSLVRFYLDQGREDDACDWVRDHSVSNLVLHTLAERVLARRPLDALAYHFKVAATTVDLGNNDAYQQAIDLLRKLEQTLAADSKMLAIFNQHLNQLALEKKRKRNFIKLVDHHFGSRLA